MAGNEKKPDEDIDIAALLGLTLQFADMVLITAPAFAEGSQGGRVVALARAFKPKLAAMLAAERKKRPSGPFDASADMGKADT